MSIKIWLVLVVLACIMLGTINATVYGQAPSSVQQGQVVPIAEVQVVP